MPTYEYEHPNTKEIFTDLRKMEDRDKPFIAPDGKECKRVLFSPVHGWRSDREGFEMDPDYYKEAHPKYVKYRDGHREKYDPTKHR